MRCDSSRIGISVSAKSTMRSPLSRTCGEESFAKRRALVLFARSTNDPMLMTRFEQNRSDVTQHDIEFRAAINVFLRTKSAPRLAQKDASSQAFRRRFVALR